MLLHPKSFTCSGIELLVFSCLLRRSFMSTTRCVLHDAVSVYGRSKRRKVTRCQIENPSYSALIIAPYLATNEPLISPESFSPVSPTLYSCPKTSHPQSYFPNQLADTIINAACARFGSSPFTPLHTPSPVVSATQSLFIHSGERHGRWSILDLLP